jgi:hypothetical protein
VAEAGAAGRWVGGVIFYPNLKNYIHSITASTAVNAVTWTASNHPKYASMLTNIEAYRCTSMGVRLYNTGALLDEGVTILIGYLPSNISGAAPATNLYDTIQFSDNFRAFSSKNIEELEAIWLPCTIQSSVGAYNSALGFRSVSEDCFDNNLCIYVFSYRSDTPSDSIQYEHSLNLQFFPRLAEEYLFAPKTVTGSPEAIGAAFEAVASQLDRSGGKSVLRTGVKRADDFSFEKVLDGAAYGIGAITGEPWLGPAWDLGKQVFKGGWFGGKGGAGVGLFSAASHRLRLPEDEVKSNDSTPNGPTSLSISHFPSPPSPTPSTGSWVRSSSVPARR